MHLHAKQVCHLKFPFIQVSNKWSYVANVKFDPFIRGKFLQWVKLLENMAEHCIYLNNYPEPILLPFEQHPTSNKNKGVGNLWLMEQHLLLTAFRSSEHPCEFLVYGTGSVADWLSKSWSTVHVHISHAMCRVTERRSTHHRLCSPSSKFWSCTQKEVLPQEQGGQE